MPTKKQLGKMREAEFEYPQIRREDDPAYLNPASKIHHHQIVNYHIMTEKELKKQMETDYPLIPMLQITDEARLLAVAWVDGYESQGMDIPGKQKLASDIMNYARRAYSSEIEALKKEVARVKELLETECKQHSKVYFEYKGFKDPDGEYAQKIWDEFKKTNNL